MITFEELREGDQVKVPWSSYVGVVTHKADTWLTIDVPGQEIESELEPGNMRFELMEKVT
jgi:hypothetical protein